MTDRHLPQDCIFVFPGPGGPDSDHSDDAVTWTSEALDMARHCDRTAWRGRACCQGRVF
jgi:hypothetical protein